jgi:hypothetical protein
MKNTGVSFLFDLFEHHSCHYCCYLREQRSYVPVVDICEQHPYNPNLVTSGNTFASLV